MTTTFATDSNNDLYLGNDGNIVILHGLPAVTAACKTATQAQLGEMVLETELGIPNFQAVWNGSPNYPLWSLYLRNTLEAVIGVNEVTSLELQVLNNVLNYTATIASEFGQAEITNA